MKNSYNPLNSGTGQSGFKRFAEHVAKNQTITEEQYEIIKNSDQWLSLKDFGSCYIDGVKYVREDVQLDNRGLVSRELFEEVVIQLLTKGLIGDIELLKDYAQLIANTTKCQETKDAIEVLLNDT